MFSGQVGTIVQEVGNSILNKVKILSLLLSLLQLLTFYIQIKKATKNKVKV